MEGPTSAPEDWPSVQSIPSEILSMSHGTRSRARAVSTQNIADPKMQGPKHRRVGGMFLPWPRPTLLSETEILSERLNSHDRK